MTRIVHFLLDVVMSLASLVSAVVLAASVAGFFGGFRYLELMSDFRPYWLGIGAAILLVMAMAWRQMTAWRRGRVAVLASAMAIVATNGCEVLPWLWAARPDGGTASPSLKAMGFNVEGVNTQYGEVCAFVEREAPDVVMFCEASKKWRGELLRLQRVLPYHTKVEAMDIVVFSRHPIGQAQVYHFGPQRGFVTVPLKVEGREILFVAAHAYPHHSYGVEGFRWRNEMLEKGLVEAANSTKLPLIVMGDLNVSPWSPTYKTMIQGSRLRDGRRGFGLLQTHHGHRWPGSWAWRPIDHCLHSPNLAVRRIWTGPDLGSDHLPVLVEFEHL